MRSSGPSFWRARLALVLVALFFGAIANAALRVTCPALVTLTEKGPLNQVIAKASTSGNSGPLVFGFGSGSSVSPTFNDMLAINGSGTVYSIATLNVHTTLKNNSIRNIGFTVSVNDTLGITATCNILLQLQAIKLLGRFPTG